VINIPKLLIKKFSEERRMLDLHAYLILSHHAAGRGWVEQEEAIRYLSTYTEKSTRTCRNYLNRLQANNLIKKGRGAKWSILGRLTALVMLGERSKRSCKIEVSKILCTTKEFKKNLYLVYCADIQSCLRFKDKRRRMGKFGAPRGQSYIQTGLKSSARHQLEPSEIGVSVSLIKRNLGLSVGTICNFKVGAPIKKVNKILFETAELSELRNFFISGKDLPDIHHTRVHRNNNNYVVTIRYPDVFELTSHTSVMKYARKSPMGSVPIMDSFSLLYTNINKTLCEARR